MKFQYIGCGAHDAPRQIRVFGHDFTLMGEPVEVLDPHVIKKLMGCATFVHEPVLAAPVEPVGEVNGEDEGDVSPENIVTVAPKRAYRKANK